jgi:hypothetical protein
MNNSLAVSVVNGLGDFRNDVAVLYQGGQRR